MCYRIGQDVIMKYVVMNVLVPANRQGRGGGVKRGGWGWGWRISNPLGLILSDGWNDSQCSTGLPFLSAPKHSWVIYSFKQRRPNPELTVSNFLNTFFLFTKPKILNDILCAERPKTDFFNNFKQTSSSYFFRSPLGFAYMGERWLSYRPQVSAMNNFKKSGDI